METFKKNCPSCNNEIIYTNKQSYRQSILQNKCCKKCAKDKIIYKEKKYLCKCANCDNEINYTTEKAANEAKEKKSLCRSCTNKIIHNERKNSEYKKKCHLCDNEIKYSNEKQLENAIQNESICLSCAGKKSKYNEKNLNRECPNCKTLIYYSNEKCFNYAINNNRLCQSCNSKKNFQNPITKQKLLNQMQNHNPMKGKSLYDVWLEKDGKEMADKKIKDWKEKLSQNNKGENNPMYGKPSPKGAGNGWSGYYKGIYFRSILELSYLKYLLDNNIQFESGELKYHAIEYEINGVKKNYFTDFYLIETKEYIEIKPQNLINSFVNKHKFEAARNKLQNQFKILTENNINKINIDELWDLYNNGSIIFDKRYEEKFINYYNKQKDDLIEKI